jgi:hypothetical protein
MLTYVQSEERLNQQVIVLLSGVYIYRLQQPALGAHGRSVGDVVATSRSKLVLTT